MKYRGIELKENTEAEILIALEVTGITDDEELENYIDEIYDNLINVRINDQTFDEKGVYIVTSLYNEIRSKAYDNVNCSIGVNVDTFFTDDDGTEYNEDLVTLEQFIRRLEM